MALLGLRNCSIIRYPLVLLGGFLAISIITAFSYTTRNALRPYFSKQQTFLPEHSEVDEVRQVRIAIEEAGGSLSFYLLKQPDAALNRSSLNAGFHEEVFGALIYSALQIPGVEVDFYRDHGFRYGFGDILSAFYDKPVKRLDALYHDLSVEEDGSRIDVVISTTCSSHLSTAGKRMMDAYEAREKKFKLLCVIHHAYDMDKMEKDLRPWALNGALSLITLSEQ